MNKLYQILPETLQKSINLFFPALHAATAYSLGKYDGQHLVDLIMKGDFQLWAAVDEGKINGIALTELLQYPKIKICKFICATGEGAVNWVGLIEEIQKWAIENGAKSFEAECRPGWEKLLKPYGYAKHHVILSRELAC